MKKIIIDLGKKESSLGISFVALSRVKHYSDVIIKPFTLDRLTKIKNSTVLKSRQDEEKRISVMVKKTLETFKGLFSD